jgi:hypothetical protein
MNNARCPFALINTNIGIKRILDHLTVNQDYTKRSLELGVLIGSGSHGFH